MNTQLPHRLSRIAISALISFVLAGCATAPTYRNVNVEVPVECQEKEPERPNLTTEQFTAKPTLDQWVQAAQVDLLRLTGYTGKLRAALQACTDPIK